MMAVKKLWPLFYSILFIALLSGVVMLIKANGYWLSYQVSISMPKGWYLIKPITKRPYRGEIVVFKPPVLIQQFLQRHHWVPDDGIIMKHIIGMPGDFVCKHAGSLWLNGKPIAPIYIEYAPGKRLPSKKFCGMLTEGHYLLMSLRVPNSFDSRYFGPITRQNILGEAVIL